MRARLKSLWSPDVLDLPNWQPEDPTHVGFLLQVEIGPVDAAGGDSFDLMVCTPSWLSESMLDTGVRSGEHTVFLTVYDFGVMRRYLERFIHACEAETWSALAGQLGRLGRWEYAGYPAGSLYAG